MVTWSIKKMPTITSPALNLMVWAILAFVLGRREDRMFLKLKKRTAIRPRKPRRKDGARNY